MTAIRLALGLFLLTTAVQAQDDWVMKIAIKGTINTGTLDFLKYALKQSREQRAKALLVELDTPGGLVASVKEMAQVIDASEIPVVVHVVPTGAAATSAGALLTLAAHHAFMAEGTHIGAAHPVDSSGKDIPGAMGEKATQDTAAFARGLAEKRKRSIPFSEAMVRDSKSFSAQEAMKNGLIDGLTANTDEILRFLEGKKEISNAAQTRVVSQTMPLAQRILQFLGDPNIAGILLSLAMACIYIELSAPGVSLPGIVGVISLILSFMSFQMLPVRTGGLILLGLGIIFFLAEALVTSHGLLAAGGAVSFVLGLIWVVDPAQSDWVISPQVWIPIGLILFSVAAGFGWLAGRAKKLSLQARQKIGGGDDLGVLGYNAVVEIIEGDGKSGRVHVRGESWEFDSEVPVQPGQAVRITGQKGFRLQVLPK
ncbi:MAG: nodulation protein NfeD [Bdellovibrionales bacterium]|nr:nodulation protein NfeD [Bdellovibrionales bacterium]